MEMIVFTLFGIILMIKLNGQLVVENLVLRQRRDSHPRWDYHGNYNPLILVSKVKGFLRDFTSFDARF